MSEELKHIVCYDKPYHWPEFPVFHKEAIQV